MKLLVFEYSCLCDDNTLISEGLYMLKGLLADLEDCPFQTYFLIKENINIEYDKCSPIIIEDDFFTWLKTNCENFDYCLFIAPEDDFIQYNISRILEDKKVNILGSTSQASFICSSKYSTYKQVKCDVLKIKTLKINPYNIDYKNIMKLFINYNCIIKPDNKTSSDLIYHISSKEEFEKVMEIYKQKDVLEVLVQEYILGNNVSVSAICDNDYVNCISVNSQEIKENDNKLEYNGCNTPLNYEYKDRLFSLTEKIIKDIPGIRGFCGIDYIVSDENIYFVEVNARITTPFIVLQEKCKTNLTENIINLLIYNKKTKITFNGHGSFKKRN